MDGEEPPHPDAEPRRSGAMHRLRNYFLTGLVIAAPLFLTIYITWGFIVWIDSWVTPLIPAAYSPDTYLPFSIPGFGLLVAIVTITLIGFLTANLVGRTAVSWGESVLGRMPVVRNLYGGLKQIFETVLSNRAKTFQTVGLIQYPRKGIWAIVFIATGTKGEVGHHLGENGETMVSVFLPTTPNPTSGFLLFVPERDVVRLRMTVEEAAKLVISAGLVSPDFNGDDTNGDDASPPATPPISIGEAGRRVKADATLNRP
ncbi:DUF502 domain-containing protein [Bauldia sp.]|uniref:DUF502 domain-containing protein n=1 Tax=Bauldia sp. TaxID=2575872 RepID=UPI003BAB6E40